LYSLAFILLYSTLTGVSALAYPRYLGTVWPTYILLADYAENKVVLFTYVVISFTIAAVALTLHSSWIFVA
jgi:hypothetical protein